MRDVIISIAVIAFPAIVIAQADRATIRGNATDVTGGIVPKAEITVVELATNTLTRTVHTDEAGNYEIADLKPGAYRFKADAAGFKTFVAENLVLVAAQVRRVDFVFQVGATTENVTVEAGLALITTDR